MSAGDLVNPKRVRIEANERLDTVDTDALSRTALDVGDAILRSVVASPRATAGSPIGLIISGFTLTIPSPAGAGKVRIDATPGVAIDSNGRVLIKPTGTVDVVIPADTNPYQIYVYYQETTGDNAKRRFLSVTAPYTETARSVDTSFMGGIGVYVRAGTGTIASDTINGQTQALCLIGIASNNSGTISIAGWDATTAPNGTDIVNRLTPAVAPTPAPTSPYINGSVKSLVDLIQNLAYFLGQAVYRGSAALTPAAANNYGAFTLPAQGLQKVAEDLAAYHTQAHSWLLDQTFETGITLPVDMNLTLSGTGRVIHDEQTYTCPFAYPGDVSIVSPGSTAQASGTPGHVIAASTTAFFPVRGLETGRRLVSITINSLGSVNSTIYSLVLTSTINNTFGLDVPGTTVTSSASGVTLTPTPPNGAQSAGVCFWIKVITAAGTDRTLLNYVVYYDVP